MHIAIVHRDLHSIARGGICTLYIALAAELLRSGHRVSLIGQDTPHPPKLPGAEVHLLPRTDNLTRHRQTVANLLQQLRPDVAECSSWEAELLDYLRLPERARVLVRGDLSAATMSAAALTETERQICLEADQVVAVSEFAAADLAEAYNIIRPAVIANGVDRGRFSPQGHHRPVSGWQASVNEAGAVVERRPLPDLLDADHSWNSYFTAGPAAVPRLVWVGKFTHMKGFDRLQALSPALVGRAQLVIVLGHGQVHYPIRLPDSVLICQDLDGNDLPAVYRSADYLISTSRWEGFGLGIGEALACGTPALLPADLGVAPELITDEVTGARWADPEHLLTILAGPIRLTGSLPATYTWAANASATLAVYANLLRM